MKKITILLLFISALYSNCKKKIEEKQLDLLYQIITEGRWYVEQYKENSIDVTGDFFGYEFQFYKDDTVDGIKVGGVKKGTWKGNLSEKTIVAAFPSAAGDTLKRLTATWKIIDSGLDFVEAQTTTSTGINRLSLQKK
jgi:hypothetical protein